MLTSLGRLPHGVIDDAQMRHVGNDPVTGRIQPRESFPGIRITACKS